METEEVTPPDTGAAGESEEDVDPIFDIIDYLVRCAKISFKNAHVDQSEVSTDAKIQMACNLFKRSPTEFLMQFGKYLTPSHMNYFENLNPSEDREKYKECIKELKIYLSDDSRRKRTRNRRYKALQKLQDETDYFSEKQMMYRNPLLYEQLVGQYLTDEEISERDGVDRENLTFLNMILETVDRNQMRETKNVQLLTEEDITTPSSHESDNEVCGNVKDKPCGSRKQWGDFETPDTTPSFKPEPRKQAMISAPERELLREEFLQEMYSSFIDGRDIDVDYQTIDNDEQYDDLKQVNQDAEDKYFDSETNESENLEEHMQLVQEYGRKKSNDSTSTGDDPLDVFMKHIALKQGMS